jgi:NAD+ kinase
MITQRGLTAVVCPLPENAAGASGTSVDAGLAVLREALGSAGLLVALGGDGTILRAARQAADFGVPILGVNLGGKGFMAELERDDAGVIADVASGGFDVESRMMLDVELVRDGRRVGGDFALNDVVIGGMTKVIDLTLCGDGSVISTFSGDGAVIATPTGSTAYSLSAGGPIVEPSARNIIVTPICAHTLKARPFVLAAERLVSARLGRGRPNTAYMSVDGCEHKELAAGDAVDVKCSDKTTRFVRLSGGSFYKRVSEKLGESA